MSSFSSQLLNSKPKPRRKGRPRVTDAKRLKDKRGIGEFEHYIPWIWVTDFSPHSFKFRIPGIKIKRLHHALSLLEARVFFILEAMPDVIDIREQFPLLPLVETVEIAVSNNIRHPTLNGVPLIRTTDFLVITKSGTTAISVKYKKDLIKSKRKLELAEIERQFWKRRGIEFLIIFDTSITRSQHRNAKRIRSFSDRPPCKISNDNLVNALAEISDPDLSTRVALKNIAFQFNEPYRQVHHLFLHLIFIQRIKINYQKVYAIDSTISDLCL